MPEETTQGLNGNFLKLQFQLFDMFVAWVKLLMLLSCFPCLLSCARVLYWFPPRNSEKRTKYPLAEDLKLANKRNVPLETKFKIGVFRHSVCWYDNSYHFVLIFGASLTNPRYRMRQTTVIHVTFAFVTMWYLSFLTA